jgi:hypothetical protein
MIKIIVERLLYNYNNLGIFRKEIYHVQKIKKQLFATENLSKASENFKEKKSVTLHHANGKKRHTSLIKRATS